MTGSDSPVDPAGDNEDDELSSFAGRHGTLDADDRITGAMPAIGSATPRLSTEYWATDRFEAMTAGDEIVPVPATGGVGPVTVAMAADRRPGDDLTFDEPGVRQRRRWAPSMFAALAVTMVAAAVILLAVRPSAESATAGNRPPTAPGSGSTTPMGNRVPTSSTPGAPVAAHPAASRTTGAPATSAVSKGVSVRSFTPIIIMTTVFGPSPRLGSTTTKTTKATTPPALATTTSTRTMPTLVRTTTTPGSTRTTTTPASDRTDPSTTSGSTTTSTQPPPATAPPSMTGESPPPTTALPPTTQQSLPPTTRPSPTASEGPSTTPAQSTTAPMPATNQSTSPTGP